MLEDRMAELAGSLKQARAEQEAATESAKRALQTCKAAQTEACKAMHPAQCSHCHSIATTVLAVRAASPMP